VLFFEIFLGNCSFPHHIIPPRTPVHFIMVTTIDEGDLKFNGSNWQALTRVVALSRFTFLQDEDYADNEPRKCAYLASRLEGPALDWAASIHATTPLVMESFSGYVDALRQAFGVADNNITALLRRDLDALKWSSNIPVFFAEFDRLVMGLGISSHEVRVAMVEAKLPQNLKILLSQQALSFSNYDTMRERFNTMWAMDPTRGTAVSGTTKKPRCGSCGKKGHTAPDCRGSKN